VLSELTRRENLLSSVLANSKRVFPSQEYAKGKFSIICDDQFSSDIQTTSKINEVIRDLVDFQIDVLKQKTNFASAQDFIRDNPDEMVNRILSHVQYIYGINNLEGLIPRMNQVYIFTQELVTFLRSVRDILEITSKDCPDSALLVEIERIIRENKNKLSD